MNLPFILDVTVGLIFIYLILSLLASEIQEMIATIFQWRAEHLRKSIENFLAGDDNDSENEQVVHLANLMYNNPLIKNINQQAKGFFVTLPRKFTWAAASAYRSMKFVQVNTKRSQGIFGSNKHSAPSYIPADIFATTLFETLQISSLVQKLTESRLEKFQQERIAEIQQVIDRLKAESNIDDNYLKFIQNIQQELSETREDFNEIILRFQQGKSTLDSSIARMAESVDKYIENFQNQDFQSELYDKALRRLKFFRKDIFDDTERAIMLGGLRPTVKEVVQAVNRGSAIYNELEAAFQDKESASYKAFQEMIYKLPPSVVENLEVLAKRAQSRVKATESGIQALRQELQYAFDSSMERASGVYKRNAKGVALLIGFALAFGANADAFHMISRLSKDSALRDIIVDNAGQLISQNNDKSLIDINQLRQLRQQANQALNDISLPVGWTQVNLQQQMTGSSGIFDFIPGFGIFRVIFGWFISGIAISMGAAFWFDLLGKVINVRNAGRRPVSSARNEKE